MIYEFHNRFDVTLSEEYRMAASPGFGLLAYAAIAIIALIVLIARYRLNPFIVITLVSIGLAQMAGMPADTIMGSYEAGVGKTLGHIALVVALGTMLGKMMAESGGAEQMARTLIERFGEKNAHWAMVCIAFLVGLPLFFEVGFVLLVPIAFTVARRVGVSILMVGLPMVAGLSVSLLAPRRRIWARYDATTVRLAVVGGDPFTENECARLVAGLPAVDPARN